MTYEEFQRRYESGSAAAYAELHRLDEEALLAVVASRREDLWEGQDHYQIWNVLRQKGTRRSVWPLFGIVSDLRNAYLIRYHACSALFGIAGIADEDLKGRVQYGLDAERRPADRQQALARLEALLQAYAGRQA
jgi:hypothetical protein